MKSLILILVSLFAMTAAAETVLTGELALNAGSEKRCVRDSDTLWGGIGYSLTKGTLGLDEQNDFVMSLTFASVRCVKAADGTLGFIVVDPAAPYSYDVGHGAHVQHVTTVRRESEIVVVNPSVAILGRAPVGGVSTGQILNFRMTLKDVLGADGWARLNAGEKVNFRMDLGLRWNEFYTINGGAENALGQRFAKSFQLNGTAIRQGATLLIEIVRAD